MKDSRTGEYITFGVSFFLVAGLLIYFIFTFSRHDKEERLAFSSRVIWEEISEYKGQFVVPVEIENKGNKTANELRLKIKSKAFESEARIEYLARNGSRKIFLILPERPEKDSVSVTPIFYFLD